MKVSEVAQKIGFASQNYSAAVFKKKFGFNLHFLQAVRCLRRATLTLLPKPLSNLDLERFRHWTNHNSM
ncbi:MAG: hypothetical protein V7K18_15750 [Nostoc sp.]|uniref:hypothetical protein n=1 Tax=Nostoc sp. TaxID=1180 RepID=UPI002FFB436C